MRLHTQSEWALRMANPNPMMTADAACANVARLTELRTALLALPLDERAMGGFVVRALQESWWCDVEMHFQCDADDLHDVSNVRRRGVH